MILVRQMPTPRLEAVSDFDPRDVLETSSTAISYGATSDDLDALALFESRPVSVSATAEGAYLLDCVLYGGGLCNTLDWCPVNSEEVSEQEFLALSCHTKGHSRNRIGSVLNGSGVVQIWSIDAVCEEGRSPARLAMGLVHDGAVCWYLQWCPDPEKLIHDGDITRHSIGLLAMALGNGDVHITAVPQPSEGMCFVNVRPWVRITRTQLQGSIVSCLDWQPCVPHELLLLGCWDGTVSIWALPCQERQEAQHLLLHTIDYGALRRVVWMKPPPGANTTTDPLFRSHFCVVGHTGHLSIWSSHSMGLESLHDWTLSRMWLMDADVSNDPFSVYVALEDASLRQLPLEMEGFTDSLDQSVFHVYSGQNKGAIHTVRCSPCSSLVAYGGEDGEIAVFAKENVGDTRYRKPHVGAGAMKYNEETKVLHVITASEFQKIGGVYIGGPKFAASKPKASTTEPNLSSAFEYQTIQCLSFSPNGAEVTWLAAGGISGCIRIIRIQE